MLTVHTKSRMGEDQIRTGIGTRQIDNPAVIGTAHRLRESTHAPLPLASTMINYRHLGTARVQPMAWIVADLASPQQAGPR